MPKKAIQLSDHFTYSRLLRFVLPCIGTMLFTSIYGIVDGLCVSNFVGKTAFAAVNLIMPLPQLLATIGFMLGTGGSAIVGITLGEGDQKKADRYFTLFLLADSSVLTAQVCVREEFRGNLSKHLPDPGSLSDRGAAGLSCRLRAQRAAVCLS